MGRKSSPLERAPFTRLKSLLRQAGMTTRRARRRPSHSAAFVETLEPRALLSAPTPAADMTAPRATAVAEDVTTAGDTSYTFTVQFSDDVAIDVSTIDEWDVSLSGPNATSPRPLLVSLDVELDGTPRTATYRITPPGGAWTKSDNGTYHISLRNLVSDTSGNRVPAGFIGSFDVNVPDVEPPSAALATAVITLGGLWTLVLILFATLPGYLVMIYIEPAMTQQVQRVLGCLLLTAVFALALSAAVGSLFRRAAPATMTAYAALLVVCAGTLLVWLGRDAPFGHGTVENVLKLNPVAAALSVIDAPGFEVYELVPANWWVLGIATAGSFLGLAAQPRRLVRPQ